MKETGPIVTHEPDGWVKRTYRDGSWTRTCKADDGLYCQYSWDPLAGTPEAVRLQDLAAAREAGARAAYAREEAFWKAFLGK